VVYHDCAAHIQRVSQVTEIVHGKWKLRILCAMRTKPVRLSQLMRYPGASKKALRASLRPWNRRMVVRRDMSGAVLHVEYDFADDMRGIVGFSSRQYGGLGSDPSDQAKRPHASLMNFEAQPRRITAVTEPAKPWFVSWDLCRPPPDGSHRRSLLRGPARQRTPENPVRIAAMEADLERGGLPWSSPACHLELRCGRPVERLAARRRTSMPSSNISNPTSNGANHSDSGIVLRPGMPAATKPTT